MVCRTQLHRMMSMFPPPPDLPNPGGFGLHSQGYAHRMCDLDAQMLLSRSYQTLHHQISFSLMYQTAHHHLVYFRVPDTLLSFRSYVWHFFKW